ncbi:MAG TPA: universal stress protein [Candidatus Aquilonibacter sp.]
MFNTILVAVDQSEAAQAACDLAIAMAKEDKASLLLLSIVDVSKLIAVAGYEAPYPVDAITMLRAGSEELLAGMKASCEKQGVSAATLLGEGDACDEILRVAQEHHAGLICMGTHGRQGLSRLFIGSVAEGVLRRATVPVITTKPQPVKAKKAADTRRLAAAPAAK